MVVAGDRWDRVTVITSYAYVMHSAQCRLPLLSVRMKVKVRVRVRDVRVQHTKHQNYA